jgi:hypothetical protein
VQPVRGKRQAAVGFYEWKLTRSIRGLFMPRSEVVRWMGAVRLSPLVPRMGVEFNINSDNLLIVVKIASLPLSSGRLGRLSMKG